MSEGTQHRLRPDKRTAITVTRAGTCLHIDAVAIFVDDDEQNVSAADRLRRIADTLHAYADRIGPPLFIEDVPTARVVQIENLDATLRDFLNAPRGRSGCARRQGLTHA